MHTCLEFICHEFESVQDFLQDKSPPKCEKIDKLFVDFMECFKGIGVEKLKYPSEFINDVRLYHEGFAQLLQKFEDIEIRYLMLSDFYDFARLTKRYKPNNKRG